MVSFDARVAVIQLTSGRQQHREARLRYWLAKLTLAGMLRDNCSGVPWWLVQLAFLLRTFSNVQVGSASGILHYNHPKQQPQIRAFPKAGLVEPWMCLTEMRETKVSVPECGVN